MANLSRKEFLKKSAILLAAGPFTLSALGSFRGKILAPPFNCVLQPVHTGGPFYLDPAYARQDISEELPGIPLRMNFQVIGVDNCLPVPGAIVNVWHCDHRGVYSEFGMVSGNLADASDETFYRGYQTTDAEGRCSFDTKFPGWYPGRATHFHFDVHIGFDTDEPVNNQANVSSSFLSQIYVPDALKTQIYTELEPYTTRGDNATGLEEDFLFDNDNDLLMSFNTDDYPNALTGDFCIALDMAGTDSVQELDGKQFFEAKPNFPNPFTAATNIPFELHSDGTVTLSVFDSQGELIEQLAQRKLPAGSYSVAFDANEAKHNLAAGNYFYELYFQNKQGRFKQTGQMVLVK